MNYLINAECINTNIVPFLFNDRYGWKCRNKVKRHSVVLDYEYYEKQLAFCMNWISFR